MKIPSLPEQSLDLLPIADINSRKMMSMVMLAEFGMIDWIALGVATLAVIYVLARSKMRRKREPLADPLPKLTLSRQRSLERDMQILIVELSNMARQITGQLDTRAAKLELLIQEANQKIAALQRANGAHPSALTPFEMDDEPITIPKSAHAIPKPVEPPPVIDEVPPLSPPAPPEPVDPVKQRHLAVYDLADKGFTPQQIACELNRPAGEIELILALRSE